MRALNAHKISFHDYWQLLRDYLRPQFSKLTLLVILLFVNIGLQLFNPQLIRIFIDTAKSGGALQTLLWLAVAFVSMSVVQQIATTLISYTSEVVGWNATNALRSDLFKHCMDLDMSFHNRTTPGHLMERIDGDVSELENYFSLFVVQVLSNIALLIGVNAVLCHINWRLGLAFSTFSLISLIAFGAIRNVAVPHFAAAREADAEVFGLSEEYLGGTEDIRSSGSTNFVIRQLQKVMGNRVQKNQKAALASLIPLWVMIVGWTVGHILAVTSGYYLFKANLITIGTVYLILHYTYLLFNPLQELVSQLTKLQMATACIKRVNSLFSQQSAVSKHRNKTAPKGALAVEFDRVSFAYTEDNPVLKDVSFSLEPGKVLGIIGRTGSGKTTVSRLIYRLYEYGGGTLRLGGTDIRDIPVKALRQRVGVVLQEVQLFHTTVRENLRLYDEAVSDQRLLQTLEEINLRPWLESLPDGLDTVLDAKGGGLSAGQSQLLGLARVFLKNPGLIVLDEPTSRLDPVTESLLEKAMNRLLENATGIIIAHHLITLHRADQILILDDGKVAEYGERDILQQNHRSLFSQLLREYNNQREMTT